MIVQVCVYYEDGTFICTVYGLKWTGIGVLHCFGGESYQTKNRGSVSSGFSPSL